MKDCEKGRTQKDRTQISPDFLCHLPRKRAGDRLTEDDMKLFRQAQEFLVGELALSQDIEVEAAQRQVETVLESLDTPEEVP